MSLQSKVEDRLRRLLNHIETRLNIADQKELYSRYVRALGFSEADRLPLALYIPWRDGSSRPFPLREAYKDPAKMMVNELLCGFTNLLHVVEVGSDNPLCIRPNLGVGIVASTFGAKMRFLKDNMPWVNPLGPERITEIIEGDLPPVDSGLVNNAVEMYEYFHETLSRYPNCQKAILITLPDLQGPFSTAELLWGPKIYTALYKEPTRVGALCKKIARQMIRIYKALLPYTTDEVAPGFRCQHGVVIRANLLIRNDSVVNISPQTYQEVVLPADKVVAEEVGAVGMHFCGNGMHQLKNFLSLPNIQCIDIGQPELLDLDCLYTKAATSKVALVRVSLPEGELCSPKLRERFPTGISLVATVQDLGHAKKLWKAYMAAQEEANAKAVCE